ILDGFGVYRDYPGNAVRLAATPNVDRWSREFPYTEMSASGRDVGLPSGQMGNSEVGHLNLGAGFIVDQWITRLDKAIEDGSFFANPALVGAVEHAARHGMALHVLGLLGNGGVHASDNHLRAVLRLARDRRLERVFVHPFTDGRDTPPDSARGFVRDLEDYLAALGAGRIATIAGRYYAMDRDKRWDRTARAYAALVEGAGARAASAPAAVEAAYAEGITDEFIRPTVIAGADGQPVATINSGDAVIFTNFRNDRTRQLTHALVDRDFAGFPRALVPRDLHFVTMTEYEEGLPVAVAFAPHDVREPLAAVLAARGRAQFHAAETEKYPHVTFFFNGGREAPFPGEERALIPSPKVATYDLQPEMSAAGVADAAVGALASGRFDFAIINFANPDMVGHTGVLSAAIAACETADRCAGRVVEATLAAGGVALITADHGNAEVMIDEATGGPHTAHTTNPVPVWLASPSGDPLRAATLRRGGRLADVAPTLLGLLGLPLAPDMTGASLIAGAGQV
ncbi:MAG: 2,3-bisphosphoglycerate-independent phosphoglycerate mutase, partial [Chloroflexota bacterium]|nr:2,3-bisphosphoglycerate-independent phosphoglycerate mutase [Chloroflexota bacterium]